MSPPAVEPPAVVVWLGDAARPGAQRALDEWARARGVRLTTPDASETSRAQPSPLEVADRVEREIARAADAVSALDADAAERALARAEQALRAAPELPQAPWLLAEVQRGWAARWARVEPRDEARARLAWQAAHALDGGRVAGVGETQTAAPVEHALTLSLGGAPASAIVRFDGVALQPSGRSGGRTTFSTRAAPGTHHVAVELRGLYALAAWVNVPAPAASAPSPTPPAASVALELGEAASCDAESLAGAAARDGRVQVPAGASCPRWVAVVPLERPGAIAVAQCERDACGPLLEWRVRSSSTAALPPPPPHGKWPAWATWTLVGVGVAAAATTAVIASGALGERPVEQRFIAGGSRVE